MNRIIPVWVGLWVLSGCAGEPTLNTTVAVTAVGEPTGAVATTLVGPAGGTARSTDGKVELVVPAGALAAETALTVTPLSVTAPGGVRGYRLGPEGTTFSSPATMRFTFTDADVAGSVTSALRVAFQDEQRSWRSIKATTLEVNAITAQTTHLSDWSLTLGFQLRPAKADVLPGKKQSLSVRFCNVVTKDAQGNDLDLVGLVAECQDDTGLESLLTDWSVNGVPGGSAETGTVVGGSTAAVYTAPAKAPASNPVAVSVRWEKRNQLVSNLTVGDGLPSTYSGTITVRRKTYQTATVLPLDAQFTATVTFTRTNVANRYEVQGGSATLLQYDHDTQDSCHCVGSAGAGNVLATSFLRLDPKLKTVAAMTLSAEFPLTDVCTPVTPSCMATTSLHSEVGSLWGNAVLPCTGSRLVAYDDPRHLVGSQTILCPPPNSGGELEITWALDGS